MQPPAAQVSGAGPLRTAIVRHPASPGGFIGPQDDRNATARARAHARPVALATGPSPDDPSDSAAIFRMAPPPVPDALRAGRSASIEGSGSGIARGVRPPRGSTRAPDHGSATATRFTRAPAPDLIVTAALGTLKCLATSAMSSSLALPSTGGDFTLARYRPPSSSQSELSRLPGLTLTWMTGMATPGAPRADTGLALLLRWNLREQIFGEPHAPAPAVGLKSARR